VLSMKSGLSARVAIIGSVGIPNRYGGPEAFAESISPELVSRGHRVIVTCDRGRYLDSLASTFRGVRRVFIPISANGALSPFHDLLAFLAVFWRVDVVLVLGVSGGLFFPLLRVLCAISGSRLAVNIDGIEWRRDKFGILQKTVLFLSDRLAQRFAHTIIYDNLGLLEFVVWKEKAACVEYSGEAGLAGSDGAPRDEREVGYVLTVCRIEPENNCEVLIEGFLRSTRSRYVFVGNWSRSAYGRELRQKYREECRLDLRDPVYEPSALFALRNGCDVYLHGHSVGGTNPSLVEMLYFDSRILCWDCVFNRVTAAGAAEYFDGIEGVARLLERSFYVPLDRSEMRHRYSTCVIADKLQEAVGL
jgi:glycosyltransferase involved in cell wall biosynthesis